MFFAPGVTVSGVSSSGGTAGLSVPLLVTVDLTGLPAAASVRLAYDLLGFAATTSAVEIDDVIVAAGPQPPPLAFVLAAASDTGTVGDDLTAANPVSLVATTDPNQLMELDTDGDGFDDGAVTSDGTGRVVFSGVTLTDGANAVRMRATNPAGTAGGTVATDPGFVDIQWTDVGAAGLDATTFGITDITITGVDIDRFEDRGGGVVRYVYADDGDRLTAGGVTVTLAARQVGDRAGNTNPAATAGFTLTANRPPVAVAYPVAVSPLTVPAGAGVLANDTDADSNPLTAVLVTGPTSGTLASATGGGFTYTPNVGFSGTDGFTYQATDGTLDSAAVRVTLTVSQPVSPPPETVPPFTIAPVLAADGCLTLPGTAGQQIALRFLWEFREARFHNEVGVYRATGAGGAVSGVLPGQAGYAQAVLSAGRPQVLFTSGSRAGAFRDLTFDANDTLCFYVVQNNTTAAAREGGRTCSSCSRRPTRTASRTRGCRPPSAASPSTPGKTRRFASTGTSTTWCSG